jgi:sigma-B regulation protein RsbU (phosphoserine phosphatase)
VPLRLRILLIAAALVAVLGAALFALSQQREAVWRDARDAETRALAQALWSRTVETAALRTEAATGAAAAAARIAEALAAGELGTVVARTRAFAAAVAERHPGAAVEVLDPDGYLLTGGEAGRPLVADPLLVRRAVLERSPTRGLRELRDGRLAVAALLPLAADGTVLGVLAVAVPPEPAVAAFEQSLLRTALLVDRRGRLVQEDRAALWEAVRGRFPDGPEPRAEASRVEASLGGRVWSVERVAVADAGGGRIGTLYVLADQTRGALVAELFLRGSALAALTLLVLAVVALGLWLQRAFAPLESALGALDELAAGRTGVGTVLLPGPGEMGRLARAVEVLRERSISLSRVEARRARRLGRQQRFIRRQMGALAGTLEPGERELMLDDLARIEAEAAAAPRGAASEDALGPLAVGFQRMTERVMDQHRRMAGLVEELRQALTHKTELLSLQQELEIASRMQLSVLPRSFPDMPALDVAARMIPAKEVGGDFYDFFLIDDRSAAFVVADVSGKGIPAAFFMLIARTLLKATALHLVSPRHTLARLNDLLARENEQMMFVTLFYGVVDLETGDLRYANAGHNPPVLIRPDGTASFLPPLEGMAVAVFPGVAYAEGSLRLGPGEALALYTDGVTEAFDAAGGMFGNDRLMETARAAGGSTAAETVERLFAAVQGFAAGVPASDDVTALVLRRPAG